MRRRQSLLQPDHMQHPAFNVHLRQSQAAGLGHPQPMPEHQQQQTAVAGLVATPFHRRDQLADLSRHQMFSLTHRFVSCWSKQPGRNLAPVRLSVTRPSSHIRQNNPFCVQGHSRNATAIRGLQEEISCHRKTTLAS